MMFQPCALHQHPLLSIFTDSVVIMHDSRRLSQFLLEVLERHHLYMQLDLSMGFSRSSDLSLACHHHTKVLSLN
jgi:hypothetical protein